MNNKACDSDLTGPWTERVAYAENAEWYAYRPDCVYYPHATRKEVKAHHGVDKLKGPGHKITRLDLLGGSGPRDESEPTEWCVHIDGLDVVAHCREMARQGVTCEPNFVLFGHPTDHPSPPGADLKGSPLYGNPLYGNPMYGNPLYGNPLYGNPLYGNGPFVSDTWARPVWGTPVYLGPVHSDRFHAPAYRETGRRPTGARPASGADLPALVPKPTLAPRFIVLDTSLPKKRWMPDLLMQYRAPGDDDKPDWDGDGILDPVAGHGTFIAGILAQLAPGCPINSIRLLSSFGDGDVCDLRNLVCDLDIDENTIINMSFGGYADHEMIHLARIVEYIQSCGGVVVASAGNDGLGVPSYPSALPGVIGVGGIDNTGPAAFTNYGPWLRACAPAVDLTSSFFVDRKRELKDPQAPLPGSPDDPNYFQGWARWTGTSFAAPIVAAALAREMVRAGCTAKEAVKTVVDGPDLLRIPNLGTIVNLCPPLPESRQMRRHTPSG